METHNTDPSLKSLVQILSKYEKPVVGKSVWQILNTLVPLAVIWYLMVRSLDISYWLTLALAFPAAGLLVRTFIIFHDCVHGSFFRSPTANNICGFLTGILVLTPFDPWKKEHNLHHQTSGNLDQRGFGCVWTMTVEEYRRSPLHVRFAYRFVRNPMFLFTIIPLILFLVLHRIPARSAAGRQKQHLHLSTHLTNLGIVLLNGALIWAVGWKEYLLIQIPLLGLAFSAGVWIFYVQHQFEGTYWERPGNYDYVRAALHGSSFYQLPKVLQWFTGNIGFHHIHHLSPRIPNYLLEKCYRENPVFQQIKPVTLGSSFKSLSYRLWDEKNHRLVSFRGLGKQRQPAGV